MTVQTCHLQSKVLLGNVLHVLLQRAVRLQVAINPEHMATPRVPTVDFASGLQSCKVRSL